MKQRRVYRTLALVGGLVVGAALLPSLSGCRDSNPSVGQLIDAVWGGGAAFSAADQTEIKRFEAAFLKIHAQNGGRDLKHFKDAFRRVQRDYVKETQSAALVDAAIKSLDAGDGKETTERSSGEHMASALDAMLASLDPHSSYLDPEELAEMHVATSGEFGGLGIEITMEEGLIRIVSPIEDTPAHRAGVEPGDLITHLDGTAILGMSLTEAVRMMRGRPGTDILLTLRRKGVAPFDVTITRDIIKIRAVKWRMEDTVGYVRITSFSGKAESGLLAAMDRIRTEGGARLSGIVLDLRSNPGGLLNQSHAVADAFLNDGVVVAVKGRRSEHDRVFDAVSGDIAEGLPMIVLINGGSASASEIVASALQEHGRAVVMGRRSYGKGSVQTITPLPEEGALRLTTQLYYAPSGHTIQGLGVVPDITISREENETFKREAELPGALSADLPAFRETRLTVAQKSCPAVGEKEDRMLGCALAYLRSGSDQGFLAEIKERQQQTSLND